MKMRILATAAALMAVSFSSAAGITGAAEKDQSGAELFKAHCAVCHPDGGNIVNPRRTLHKKDRETNKMNKAEDIIKTMRNPGPGMTPFDKSTITDKDARKIAEYILTTFK